MKAFWVGFGYFPRSIYSTIFGDYNSQSQLGVKCNLGT
jgi:hypothetical protein